MAKVERITTVKNELTGEIVSQESKVVNIRPMEAEPAFIKLYIEDLGRLFQLQAGHQEILTFVAASVDYEGVVSLAIGRKARIAATLNCSIKSIDNAICEFVKRGILARIGRGEYELDPNLFAKGEWRNIRERRKTFKATLRYSAEGGRSISAEASDIADELEAAAKKQVAAR
ncbi:MAG: hypothetical protein ACXWVD_00465 [Telluria sp.]